MLAHHANPKFLASPPLPPNITYRIKEVYETADMKLHEPFIQT